MNKAGYLFLVFEGLDGCGKSTVAETLGKRLRSSGRDVLELREPGGTPLGEAIRRLLLQQRDERAICAKAELLLYMASRAQLVSEPIRAACAAGQVLLLDRFYYSSVAYQGYGLGLDVTFIERLGRDLAAGYEPHRVVLLDCAPEVALSRVHGQKDRIESRNLEFFERVRAGYLAQARERPGLFLVVDAEQDLIEVQRQVIEGLSDVL